MTTGSDEALNAESKSMSNRSFLASASRNSLCGSEKWTRTLAVSGLVSTRSTLSQVASRAARVEKKAVSRRFSGTLIRNRRGVKWLMRAAGRLGIRRAGLLGMPVPQPHDFIRGDRVLLGNAQHLFGVVFRACLGHHIAGELAHLGRSLAAPLVECNPGLEQVLGGWPEIALQSRQDQRRYQAARDTRERIAFEHVFNQSHPCLRSSVASSPPPTPPTLVNTPDRVRLGRCNIFLTQNLPPSYRRHGTSKILPICWLDSIRRCASVASMSGNRLKVNTRSLPGVQSGQTFSFTAATIAAFSSALRH